MNEYPPIIMPGFVVKITISRDKLNRPVARLVMDCEIVPGVDLEMLGREMVSEPCEITLLRKDWPSP